MIIRTLTGNRQGFGLLESIIAIGVLALLAGGAFYYSSKSFELPPNLQHISSSTNPVNVAKQVMNQVVQKGSKENKQIDQLNGNSSVDTSTSSTALTAGWKTYRNEKYGFEIMYPDFVDGLRINGKGDLGSNTLNISVTTDTVENFTKLEDGPETTHFIINSFPAASNIRLGDLFILWGKYRIGFHNNQLAKEGLLEKIAGSVQSIAASSDTSTWKTYRNEKYGFEFQYPSIFVKVDTSEHVYESSSFQVYTFQADSEEGNLDISVINKTFGSDNIQGLYGKIVASTTTIGEKVGYIFNQGDGGCGSREVETSLNNQTLHVSFSKCSDGMDLAEKFIYEDTFLINRILSTFKFIK